MKFSDLYKYGLAVLRQVFNMTPKINVMNGDYGFAGDGRMCYGATIAQNSNTLNVTDANFTQADVGKVLVVQSVAAGAPSTRFRSAIQTVVSSTQVTTTTQNTLTTLGVAAMMAYGTDDNAAFAKLRTDLATYGGSALFPSPRPGNGTFTGMFITSLGIIIPNGSTFQGEGRDYPLVQHCPVAGSSIILIGSLGGGSFVQVGDRNNTISNSTPPIYPMEACLRDLNIDAINGAASAVYMFGRRARVERCTIWRGVAEAVLLNSQNSWIRDCRIGQQNQGHCINVGAGDTKIIDNDIRQPGNGSHAIYISNSQNVQIRGNHLYRAGGIDTVASGNAGNNIYINSTGTPTGANCSANITIQGNSLDSTYGAQIVVNVAAGGEAHSITCNANEFFNNGLGDNLFPVFQMTVAATGILHGISFAGNVGTTNQNRVGAYTSLFNVANSGTLSNWSAHGNHGINCNAIFTASAGSALPDAGHSGNSICAGNTASSNTATFGNSAGTFTGSGTGVLATFSFNHSCAGTPSQFIWSPKSSAASGAWSWSASSTQITVTFGTAPLTGTNNISASWQAAL